MINWLHVRQVVRDWLRIRGDYDRFADSYALTTAARNQGLLKAVRYRLPTDRVIVILVHFPQTFELIQSLLEEEQIDYEVGPPRLPPEYLLETLPTKPDARANVLLTLASTLDEMALERPLPVQPKFKLSMMVLERHPRLEADRRIELFARICPCPVRLGYLLSLEDPVIRHCIPPLTVQVLQQLGLRDQELITSRMVSRRIDQVLKRLGWPRSDFSADNRPGNSSLQSAEEWLNLLAAPTPARPQKRPSGAKPSDGPG